MQYILHRRHQRDHQQNLRYATTLAESWRGQPTLYLHAVVLSKIAERVIGRSLVTFLHSGKFGPHQWAFTPRLSARDLVTALVMSWILAICTGHKVATYLGDISGAFDRVYKDYLLAKLQAAGVGGAIFEFLGLLSPAATGSCSSRRDHV